jgi:hypothetical protein
MVQRAKSVQRFSFTYVYQLHVTSRDVCDEVMSCMNWGLLSAVGCSGHLG